MEAMVGMVEAKVEDAQAGRELVRQAKAIEYLKHREGQSQR